MAIHFSEQELADRRAAACKAMAADGLDGLLIFRQESMYYLTGYDTFGFVYFQCLYLGADGDMFLMTRAPDLRQAQHTSVIEEIHIWVDREGVNPARELRDLLHQRRLSGKKLGVEWESYGLTAANGRRLEHALDGFCDLVDASTLISRQRLVKSQAELDYVRRAAELADDAVERDRGWKKRACDREAILLVPDQPSPLPVWGCDLAEGIDVIGMHEGAVVYVEPLDPCEPPCGGCPTVGDNITVDAVLEVAVVDERDHHHGNTSKVTRFGCCD